MHSSGWYLSIAKDRLALVLQCQISNLGAIGPEHEKHTYTCFFSETETMDSIIARAEPEPPPTVDRTEVAMLVLTLVLSDFFLCRLVRRCSALSSG